MADISGVCKLFKTKLVAVDGGGNKLLNAISFF